MSSGSATTPPSPLDRRASGVLLHVTSLPSSYGIGDFGPTALSWIDRLEQAGQSWWQTLPFGPAGAGNSPYQPLSSFALDALLISPEWLMEDQLLKPSEAAHRGFPAEFVDYGGVTPFKYRLMKTAWDNFKAGARADLRPAYDQFRNEQDHWLGDYALFRALKAKFNDAHYLQWPVDLVLRKPAALDQMRRELADRVDQTCFTQFLLFRQAARLKAYAREKGVKLIGDLPFFVSPDSSDVWAYPDIFLLDDQRRPSFVAGVPPDYFSAQGQLWGNPVYNWDVLRQSGFRWCISRLGSQLTHVDVIRLDHFRAFAEAWHVPAGAPTAQSGKWVPGPGAEFLQVVANEFGSLPFIAEDLGMITPDVYVLRDQFHLPGMRVLQFAFDGHADNPYLPENYVTNTVVYTGTHDNATTREWFEDLKEDQRQNIWKYVRDRGAKSNEPARALMELAWSSRAALAIAPLQDILNLGKEARMNVPGRADGNWGWRCTDAMLTAPAFEWLRDMTKSADRSKVSTMQVSKTLEAASKS